MLGTDDILCKKGIPMAAKKRIVQTKNPKSGHYVKIDRSAGRIISHKSTRGPYKNVPIIKKKKGQ
jgi:hypothetical protein